MNGMNEKNLVSSKRIYDETRAALIERLQLMDGQDIMDVSNYVERLTRTAPEAAEHLSDAQRRDFNVKLLTFNQLLENQVDAEYQAQFEQQTGISQRSVTGFRFDGFCLGFDAACALFERALL